MVRFNLFFTIHSVPGKPIATPLECTKINIRKKKSKQKQAISFVTI